MKGTGIKWIFIVLGAMASVIISCTVIFNILIPDPCLYHLEEMNPILNLFYSKGPSSMGHPEPTLFNFGLSLALGALIGKAAYSIFFNSGN